MICKQCNKEFELTDGEREYYKANNLFEPKRCKECRKKNKAEKAKNMSNIPEDISFEEYMRKN